MKRITTLLSLLALSACTHSGENDAYYENLYGFGDVIGSAQIRMAEPEITFQVTEDQTDSKWMHEKTVFFLCDLTHKKVENRYEARMKFYEPVLCQDVLPKSRTSEAEYGTDAVSFYQDWGANPEKRTFDIACLYTALKDSDREHRIRMILDDTRSNTDTLYLELHHQGFGESFENTAHEAKDYQVNTRYLRFDLSGCIPPDAGDEIVLSIEWDWFVSQNNILSRERSHNQEFGILKLK